MMRKRLSCSRTSLWGTFLSFCKCTNAIGNSAVSGNFRNPNYSLYPIGMPLHLSQLHQMPRVRAPSCQSLVHHFPVHYNYHTAHNRGCGVIIAYLFPEYTFWAVQHHTLASELVQYLQLQLLWPPQTGVINPHKHSQPQSPALSLPGNDLAHHHLHYLRWVKCPQRNVSVHHPHFLQFELIDANMAITSTYQHIPAPVPSFNGFADNFLCKAESHTTPYSQGIVHFSL